MPFSDDHLDLSDQMVGYWSAFQPGQPQRMLPPRVASVHRSQQVTSLDACETAESSNKSPAACSREMDITSLIADHKLDL